MALCSITAVEGESKWERGPTNGVVVAFIEKLVDPRLPYKFSINDPPSEEAHKSIARQMHAVVLLYNYYHRKQNLEFKFLDFVSFCMLASSLRPTLKPFLETICGSEVVDLNGSDVHFSLTERAVICACDIALSLDASKDAPSIEGYPISTVAVLLIDSEKKNCMLQLDAVTEGVWSLVEKEIDVFGTDEDIRAVKKRKVKDQQPLSGHGKFLQIGFDAVKDVAGIEVSDLVVLEAHVVYSLSKEKSATQFYMMECNHLFDKNKNYDLDSLVESLQGPFVEKYLDSWVTTSLVEYHRLLPYAELISSWLPRKDSSVPILSDIVTEIFKNKEAQKTAKLRVENNAQDLDNIKKTAKRRVENNAQDLDNIKTNNTERKTSISDKVANSDGKASQRKHKRFSGGKEQSSDNTDNLGCATDVSETRRESVDKGSENNHMKGPLSGHSRRQSQRAAREASASRKTKTATDFFKISVSSKGSENMNASVRSDYQNKNIPSPQLDATTKTASDFFKISVSSEGSENLNASLRSDYQNKNIPSPQLDVTKTAIDFFKTSVSSQGSEKMNASVRSDYQNKNVPSPQLDANDPENGVSSKAEETTDPLKSNDGRLKEQRLMEENGETSKQSGVVAVEKNSREVHSEALNDGLYKVEKLMGENGETSKQSGGVAVEKNSGVVHSEALNDGLYKEKKLIGETSKQSGGVAVEKDSRVVHSEALNDGLYREERLMGENGETSKQSGAVAVENESMVVHSEALNDGLYKEKLIGENGETSKQCGAVAVENYSMVVHSEALNDGLYKEEKLMGENGETSKQSGVVAVENDSMVVHSEALNGAEVNNVTHSEDPQNALALLNWKKQELVENSTYSQPQKQTRISKIYLPGISSCQDLEYVCLKNDWRLPRYMVQPSDDKFRANVIVDCRDNITLTSEGDAGPTPREARESAATKMIEKIRAC